MNMSHVTMRPPEVRDLQSLRSELDRIDDALLDLVEQRLSRSRQIGLLKRAGEGISAPLRRRRESQIVSRLARRASTANPGEVATIWRALMGVSVQTQRMVAILVHAPDRGVEVTDASRRAFGCAAPLNEADGPEEALDRARRGDAIAVIELAPAEDWWTTLAEGGLRLFELLRDRDGRPIAVAVGQGIEPSEDILVLTDAELRRRRDQGERYRTLSMSGAMRLCLAEPNRARTGERAI